MRRIFEILGIRDSNDEVNEKAVRSAFWTGRGTNRDEGGEWKARLERVDVDLMSQY